MYHVIETHVNEEGKAYGRYHKRSTHTLEEAKEVLKELESYAKSKSMTEESDWSDHYTISKDLPASSL